MTTPTDDITLSRPAKRRSRIGLFAPFVTVIIGAIAWSGYWFYTADQVEKRIAEHQALLIAQGHQATMTRHSVAGYPFRMFVTFDDLIIIAGDGKGFAVKQLQAEANAYALDKWVMVAPKGLTLYRGRIDGYDQGKVEVTGRSLRASVSGLKNPVYDVAVEAVGVTMTPSDPARPFGFTTADKFDAYMRPTKDVADSADIMIRISGARGAAGSLIGDLAPKSTVSLQTEASLDHIKAFGGGLKPWTAAGGSARAVKTEVTAGELNILASSDRLASDAAGRFAGRMKIDLSGAFNPVDVLGALRLISPEDMMLARPLLNLTLATKGTQTLNVDFRDGSAFIGPMRVAEAPAWP